MAGVAGRWTRTHGLALGAAAVAGLALRLFYLPDPGFSDDLGEFARLTAAIVENGLGRAYDARMSFGPVVAYLWWIFSLVEPAFQGALDSSALGVRLLLKTPPFVADVGLVAIMVVALRARPTWAVIGAAVVLLHPVIWFVSAWWGQYESVYVFFALLAFVLAIRDRPLLGAIALTIAMLTKPQALALGLPFAAWYLARYDLRTVIRSGMTAVVTAIALWLPFLPFDGPTKYVDLLAYYHDDRFDVLSMRAWNVWWIVQRNILHVPWVPDQDPLIGPITYRMAGYAITVALGSLVAYRVWRRPTPAVLALALAASTLIAFTFLTTMHDRYSYAALVFLALLLDRRILLAFAALLGALIMWNLLASASASTLLHWRWELSGNSGLIGSLGFIVSTLVSVALVWRQPADEKGALEASAELDAPETAGSESDPTPGTVAAPA